MNWIQAKQVVDVGDLSIYPTKHSKLPCGGFGKQIHIQIPKRKWAQKQKWVQTLPFQWFLEGT